VQSRVRTLRELIQIVPILHEKDNNSCRLVGQKRGEDVNSILVVHGLKRVYRLRNRDDSRRYHPASQVYFSRGGIENTVRKQTSKLKNEINVTELCDTLLGFCIFSDPAFFHIFAAKEVSDHQRSLLLGLPDKAKPENLI
jgi:hypothetical protein